MNCPNCGKNNAVYSSIFLEISCPDCNFRWKTSDKKPNIQFSFVKENDKKEEKEPDPSNPYTEFAKEMRLLYDALDAERFHDSRTAILSKMVSIVWDKVELKRARELHNVRRTARRYGRAVEESSNETSAENFVKEVNADNLLRNQETMNAIVKKGLGL